MYDDVYKLLPTETDFTTHVLQIERPVGVNGELIPDTNNTQAKVSEPLKSAVPERKERPIVLNRQSNSIPNKDGWIEKQGKAVKVTQAPSASDSLLSSSVNVFDALPSEE